MERGAIKFIRLFIKRVVLLPLWVFLFVALIPIDLIIMLMGESPLGMDLLNWFWED